MSSALRITLLISLLGAAVGFLYIQENDPWRRKANLETPARMASLREVPNTIQGWPPAPGSKFPELSFFDHEGKPFSINSLRGKPTLVELIAMSCAGCQAFSGGNKYGGFEGFPAQADLQSIEHYLRQYGGGTELYGSKLNFVQIIIYNLNLEAPHPIQLSAWRNHFKLTSPNTYIISGGKPLANRESYNMIPGFLLLDKDLTVRYSSTGHNPIHNLYRTLLPGVVKVLWENHRTLS
ncbi:MAG: hypothetical protein J5J00_11170 [Deltaproteobacteria bacterium]|nr:hypothetical protein [Deltaproteobacteria bacterium]